MNALLKTTWLELKLLAREPLTVIFTLALPVVMLFVLGGVFGNQPDAHVYRGVGAMDYYVPAYIGLALASLGLISLPVHLASYRELGVLRRFSASSIPTWSILGGQVIVTLLAGVVASLVLAVTAVPVYHISAPHGLPGVIAAFVIGGLAFAAMGLLLGFVMPTARSAQGLGVILWFIMLMLSGPGPPFEVLNNVLRFLGDITPLKHVVLLLQDPWLGFGWNTGEMLIVAGFGAAAFVIALSRARQPA